MAPISSQSTKYQWLQFLIDHPRIDKWPVFHSQAWMNDVGSNTGIRVLPRIFYIKQCNYPQLILWWGAKCFSLQVSKSFKHKFGPKMAKAQLNQFDQYEWHYTVSYAACRRNLKLSKFQDAGFVVFSSESNLTCSDFISHGAWQVHLNFKSYWFGITYRGWPITVLIGDRRFDKMCGKHFMSI